MGWQGPSSTPKAAAQHREQNLSRPAEQLSCLSQQQDEQSPASCCNRTAAPSPTTAAGHAVLLPSFHPLPFPSTQAGCQASAQLLSSHLQSQELLPPIFLRPTELQSAWFAAAGLGPRAGCAAGTEGRC